MWCTHVVTPLPAHSRARKKPLQGKFTESRIASMRATLAKPHPIKANRRRRRRGASRVWYPGQYFDQETGLNYNYFRDYEPGTGRYVESDPIGLDGGINTYAYVDGKPTSRIDPLGLMMSPNRECGGNLVSCGEPPPPAPLLSCTKQCQSSRNYCVVGIGAGTAVAAAVAAEIPPLAVGIVAGGVAGGELICQNGYDSCSDSCPKNPPKCPAN